MEQIVADGLDPERSTLVDLLQTEGGADIEFEPDSLGLIARTPDLFV